MHKIVSKKAHSLAPAGMPDSPDEVPVQPSVGDGAEGQDTAAKQPHATDPHRWADGTLRTGNPLALKHGRFAKSLPELPAEPAAEAAPTASSIYRQQLEVDQGGPDDLPAVARAYCQRLTELEALLRAIAGNLVEHGIFTARGRPRSALNAYLSTVGTWDRVAMRLGLERKKKDVLELDLRSYLAAQPPETEQNYTNTKEGTRDENDTHGTDRTSAGAAPPRTGGIS